MAFFDDPLPGSSTVTLHVNGSTIQAKSDSAKLDADRNGNPGGILTSRFTTVSLTPLLGTTLSGACRGSGARPQANDL